jgi:xanthine/CO dehydrogenase XdhC/CoxF family maturation factor
MKEIKAIIDAYQKIDFETHSAALATVVRVEGSSYRRAGARMLVSDSGEWIGGISGGAWKEMRSKELVWQWLKVNPPL